MLYNPHRYYDQGMDDAFMGIEPQNTDSKSYMIGYEYSMYLLNSEQEDERSVATKLSNEQNPDKQK